MADGIIHITEVSTVISMVDIGEVITEEIMVVTMDGIVHTTLGVMEIGALEVDIIIIVVLILEIHIHAQALQTVALCIMIEEAIIVENVVQIVG